MSEVNDNVEREAYCTEQAMCPYHASGGDCGECGLLTLEDWSEHDPTENYAAIDLAWDDR